MSHFPSATLNEVCEFQNGGTPSKAIEHYFTGDIPWITGADLIGPIAQNARSFITEEAIASSATNKVPAGTVLLVTRTSVGKVAIAGVELCFSQDITALLPDSAKLDASYLVHFLRTKEDHFSRYARGATIKGITRQVVADLVVPLPPLAEQRRIAAILDQAETLRTQRRTALALLDCLTQSLFLDMFGDPVANDRGWARHRIADICDLVRGSSPRPQGDPRYFGGPVPRLMVADITRDGWLVSPSIDSLTVEGARFSRPISAGTVVMAVSGNVGLVSRLAIDACVHDGFVAFKELDSALFLPAFFLLLLHFSKQAHEKHTAGAIFQNLTTTDVKAMQVIAPPLPLQQTFATRIQSIEALKTTHRRALAALDALFASLQQWAFAGAL